MHETAELPGSPVETTVRTQSVSRSRAVLNDDQANTSVAPRSRPLLLRAIHWIRRIHLYLGLFLFPWAVFYGFTGFLFNHPLAMSEQTVDTFGRDVWVGTPMETLLTPVESAQNIVSALQKRFPEKKVQLVESESVHYATDIMNASLKSSAEEFQVSLAVNGNGGTVRQIPPRKSNDKESVFPFAVGRQQSRRGGREMSRGSEKRTETDEKLEVSDLLLDRLNASLNNLVKIKKLPEGELSVTSVPDLTFVIESDGQRWRASYNALRGTVGGRSLEDVGALLSWRQFLTKMHKAHGYPMSTVTTKWFWAIGVDVMAFVMMYWGGSGLMMWWQIKSTRRWGFAILLLSAATATALAFGMHHVLNAA